MVVANGPQNLPFLGGRFLKGPGLKYGFFPRIIQTKIFWKNNLDMTQKGLAKYGGRGPKIAFVINGQSSNFFVWR